MITQVNRLDFESQFPMIKTFEVESVLYLYDGKSGMLAEISLEEIDQIYNYYILGESDNMPDYLKWLLNDGVFLPGPLNGITPKKEELDQIIRCQIDENVPKTLMIEITEKCNLNCRYCFFSKDDGFNERKHSHYNMKETIAYKAIDYYYNKYVKAITKFSPESRTKIAKLNYPMLQWWGGEPFMAFDLISKTKAYFESLDWELCGVSKKDIVYGLTSNLTLLNDEILDFIVNNNVKLRVSLDGDEESHNKNRVFPNGGGSFEVTIKNLNRIIDKYPDYAQNNVGIQSVLADNINVFRAQGFIEKNFRLNTPSNKLITCSVSPQKKKNIFISEFEITKEISEESILLFKKRIDEITPKSLAELEKLLIYNKKLQIELNKLISIEDFLALDIQKGCNTISKMFSCPIALDTIFVSVDGHFHSCAKTVYSFPFGHIDTGIDIKKLEHIYYSYHKAIEKHCKGCWAFRFCRICPALVCNESEWVLPQKEECEHIRKSTLLQLSKYIILTEQYEHLFSHIKNLLSSKSINQRR